MQLIACSSIQVSTRWSWQTNSAEPDWTRHTFPEVPTTAGKQISGLGLLYRRRRNGRGAGAFRTKATSIDPDLGRLSVSISISELGTRDHLPEARIASMVAFKMTTMIEINELSVIVKGQEGRVWPWCSARMRMMAINARSMIRPARISAHQYSKKESSNTPRNTLAAIGSRIGEISPSGGEFPSSPFSSSSTASWTCGLLVGEALDMAVVESVSISGTTIPGTGLPWWFCSDK